jgi:hypothetical protein
VQFSPDGKPVLLDEGSVRKLQEQRRAALDKALASAKPGPTDTIVVANRELRPLEVKENGLNWEGDYFTDAQMAAIRREVPAHILPPSHLAHMEAINEAIKSGRGIRKAVDYNPATKEKGRTGRRAYASQGSKFYETVPYGFFINKEGGLSVRLFDVGNVSRKLDRWMSAPGTRKQFALWNGDKRAVMADVYKYLENQLHGRPNSLHLDSDPTFAVQKRNLISDLIGGTSVRQGAIPSPLSTKAGRDNSVKMFRIDRLNKVGESAGDPFPVDYAKVKENLMPFEVGRTLSEAGKDFPVDRVKPKLIDIRGSNDQLAQRAASEFRQLPRALEASDGSRIQLWNPEAGSLASRVFHLIRDEETNRILPSKLKWVPMIAETLREAPAWILDPASKNRIYVRDYGEAGKHMVVVRPDGSVMQQGPVDASLITQFPYNSPGRQGRMRIHWTRPGSEAGAETSHGSPGPTSTGSTGHGPRQSSFEGTGQSQGNPSPTPTDSTVPGPRQSEFQGEPTQDAGRVNPPPPNVHLMPLPEGVSPSAVIRHIEAQAVTDLGQQLMQGGAPKAMAQELAQGAWHEATRLARKGSAPHERGYAAAAGSLMDGLNAQDLQAIGAATVRGGTEGAKAELKRQLLVKKASMRP